MASLKFRLAVAVILMAMSSCGLGADPVAETPLLGNEATINSAVSPGPAVTAPAAAATPAVAPAPPVTTPVAATPPVAPAPAASPGAQPAGQPGSPYLGNGETMEHRSPDGSIITISRFNGQIPEHILNPYATGPWGIFQRQQEQFLQMQRFQHETFRNAVLGVPFYNFYQDMNNMFYYNNMNNFNYMYGLNTNGLFGYNPWSPMMTPFGWPWGSAQPQQQRVQEGPARAKRNIAFVDFPKRPRLSDKFHYPALPNEYWETHPRPHVPIVDVDNTQFEHIYKNKI